MYDRRRFFSTLFLIILPNTLFEIVGAACSDVHETCKCHDSYERYNLTNGQTVCFKEFDAKTWDEANIACAKEHSYLLHSLSNISSTLFTTLANQNENNVYWLGIKRQEGFYVVHDFAPSLFKESNRWGARWKYDEPQHDCVALDILRGHLRTYDCSMSLPFICLNNQFPSQPLKSLVCPEDYLFSYQLPFHINNCVRYFEAASYTKAQQLCEADNGSLASLEVYQVFINNENDWNFEGFWLENGTAICANQNDTCDTIEHPFICVQGTKHTNVVALIHPDIPESFPSSDVDNSILTCDVVISGRNITDKENLISYQWYKNGLPINIQKRMIDLRYYADLIKTSSSPIIRQGVYHCEIKLLGSSNIVKSEAANYFYSDVSTYVMTVYGMKAEKYRDYSQLDFITTKATFKKFMTSVTADIKKKLPNFFWEFHNISLVHNLMELKFVLYVNRSIALSENSLNEKDIYDLLISSRDKIKYSIKEWKDVSLTIKNADFCFEEKVMSVETGYGKILKWKGTVQTKHAVSEPLCLNGWKLQTRVCRPSLTIGADWLPFNYSTCTKFQHSIKDLEISCSGDFKTSNQGMCYILHHSLQSWDEALETCSNVSSYLIDFNTFREIASASLLESSSYWLPVKIYPNKTLFVGMNSENKWIYENNVTSSLKDDEIVCAMAKVVNKVIQYDFASCDVKMPFICIHHPLKILEAFMFTKLWHKVAGEESCYHIESTKKTWAEANESCSSLPFNTSLLQSIYSWHKYSFFKILLQAMPVNKVSSWWMDLVQEGKELQSSHDIEFVDWKAGTNFNLSKSAGLITQDSKHGNKMKWTLKEPSSKESSICELRTAELMEDNGPTHAYIEDRTLPLHSSTDFEESISKFDLRCVPSGWFLLNSISWYKDGDHLSPGFNTSRLTLFVESHSDLHHTLSYQGYYWCSVDQLFPLKRIYSPKVLFRMPGVHTFILALYMDEDLQLHSCFKVLTETQLPPDFLQFFKDKLPESFLHAQIRSKSCDKKDLFIHLYFTGSMKNENIMLRNIQTSLYLHRTAIVAYLKKHFNTNSFLLRSTVRCSEEQILVSEKVITWPATPLKQFTASTEMCMTEEGIPLKRQCMGDFSVGAFWAPVQGNCVPVHSDITIHLHRLASNNITEENILNSSISLLQLTTNPDGLNSADVHYASQILKNMANVSSIDIEVLDNIVSTLDHLIQAANVMQTNSLSSTNVSNELIASYDSIVSRIQTGDKIIKFARNNIALSVIPLNTSEYRFTTGGILEDWNMNITTLYNGSERQLNKVFRDFEAGIVLPDFLVVEKYAENTRKLAVTIQQSYHFVKNIAVVSPLIAVSLGNQHIYDVNPPIEMIFKIHEVVDTGNESEYKCAYWDEQLNENFGGWSYKGCFSQLIHDNQMQCLCDHLTSFAVILELKPGDQLLIGHEMTLSIITYVGCIMSILGLGIIILTFVLFRKWRKELKHKALFNLSLALISFLIIFLAGIENKNSQPICLVVAICLHFFMLASFAWMLVEALVQYLSFVKVIGTYIPCFMQKAVAFAWGTPLLIVITVSSINYEYYTSREKYCWLSGDLFYYAVAAPVLSMLILNFLIFIIILYSNTCGRPSKRLRSNRDERKEAITTARAMFCVSVLLGLSWIFGFLAVDGAKLLFQYLFALFTTLQGFFMCVFFVFRQKSTRELWFTWITKSPTSDSSRTSHITDITNRAVSNLSRQSTPNRLSKAVYKTRLSYILFN